MILRIAVTLAIAGLSAFPAAARMAPAPAPAAKPDVAVHAPNAQALLAKIAARHSDLVLLGLHATIPGTQDNVIIACTDPARVGRRRARATWR